MGAEPRDPAPRVPADRDGQRGVPARRGRRRARVGERRRVVLRVGVEHHVLDPARGRGRLDGPARVGQQRPDDVLLLRRGARGAARARPRRAARAPPLRAADRGRRRRDGGRGAGLPRLQRGPRVRAGLGRRDVDRHRVRARPARAVRAGLLAAPARLPADGRGGRRRRSRSSSSRRSTPRTSASRRCSSPPGCSPSSSPCGRPACGSAPSTPCSGWRRGWRCSSRAWSRS